MCDIHICNNKPINKMLKRGKQHNATCGTHPLQKPFIKFTSCILKEKNAKLMVHLVNEVIHSQMTKLYTKLFLPSRP